MPQHTFWGNINDNPRRVILDFDHMVICIADICDF